MMGEKKQKADLNYLLAQRSHTVIENSEVWNWWQELNSEKQYPSLCIHNIWTEKKK